MKQRQAFGPVATQPRLLAAARLLALVLVVLLAQTIELTHSHDESESEFNCQICLKSGSTGNALASSDLDFAILPARIFASSYISPASAVKAPAANSRAPPLI